MKRREFVKAGAALGALPAWTAQVAAPRPADRLDPGPFTIDQDEGWYTIEATTPAPGPVRNFGLGLVGYTWEENGPALAVRRGEQTLAEAVEAIAALPFVDVLYIRCDWRDVQGRPGRLDLAPVWDLTLDAARRHGLRVGFRVQLSSPEIQTARLSLPAFVKEQVSLLPAGALPGGDVEEDAARRQHAAGHHPRGQRCGAGSGDARRLLAALGQRDPRRADPDRRAGEPSGVAGGRDGGRLLPPIRHGREGLHARWGRRKRHRQDDAARARRRRELLVALDGGRQPGPLPRSPSGSVPRLAISPGLARAAGVGVAAQAPGRDRAGGGLRQRRRRRSARD